MALWDEIGLCRKTIFQAPKKYFFAHALDCFQSTQNLYVDRLGNLKPCFTNNLEETLRRWPMGWNRALHKDSFSSSQKLLFRTCLDCFQPTQNLHVDRIGNLKHCFPITWWKQSPFWASNLRPSSPKPKRWPLCYRTLASRGFCLLILSLRWLQGGGNWPGLRLRKKTFVATWFFFRHGPLWTSEMRRSSSFSVPEPNDQTSPALQKYNCSGSEKLFLPIEGVKPGTAKKHFFATSKIVFSALPVWNSVTSPALQKNNQALKKCFFACLLLNLPTPPHYLV